MKKSTFSLERSDGVVFDFEDKVPSLDVIDVINDEENGYQIIGKMLNSQDGINSLAWFYKNCFDVQYTIRLIIISYYYWIEKKPIPNDIVSMFFEKGVKIESFSPLKTKENILALYMVLLYQIQTQFTTKGVKQK